MRVSPLPICLPQLQDRIGNTLTIGVEDTTRDDDALPGNSGTGQIVYMQPVHAYPEIRPTVCEVVACKLILFFPGRRQTPAQDNIKLVPQPLIGLRCFPIKNGNQAIAPSHLLCC